MLNPKVREQLNDATVVALIEELSDTMERDGNTAYVLSALQVMGVALPTTFIVEDTVVNRYFDSVCAYTRKVYDYVQGSGECWGAGVLSLDDIDEDARKEMLPLWVS